MYLMSSTNSMNSSSFKVKRNERKRNKPSLLKWSIQCIYIRIHLERITLLNAISIIWNAHDMLNGRLHFGKSVISPQFFSLSFSHSYIHLFLFLPHFFALRRTFSSFDWSCLHTFSVVSIPYSLKINLFMCANIFGSVVYVYGDCIVYTATEWNMWLFTFSYKEKESVYICRNQSKVTKLLLVKRNEREREKNKMFFEKRYMTRHLFNSEIICGTYGYEKNSNAIGL